MASDASHTVVPTASAEGRCRPAERATSATEPPYPACISTKLVLGWTFAPIPTVVLTATALLYAWGVTRRPGWPRGRWLAFAAGLVVLLIALCSDLARVDSTRFTAHVAQHLLLSLVAPPLLALGAPVTLLLQAGSRRTQERVLAILHSRPVVMITHPLVAWVVFGGSTIALYSTPLYAQTLHHPWLHDVVHIHFVLAGVLFFWPVVGIDPGRWRLGHAARLLYVLVALPFHAIVGLALISTRAPLWSAHTLADQQAGGGAMLLGGDLVTLAVIAIVFRQWVAADQRLAARLSAGVSAPERRAPPDRYRTR
jgi:putative copper resistance protein D